MRHRWCGRSQTSSAAASLLTSIIPNPPVATQSLQFQPLPPTEQEFPAPDTVWKINPLLWLTQLLSFPNHIMSVIVFTMTGKPFRRWSVFSSWRWTACFWTGRYTKVIKHKSRNAIRLCSALEEKLFERITYSVIMISVLIFVEENSYLQIDLPEMWWFDVNYIVWIHILGLLLISLMLGQAVTEQPWMGSSVQFLGKYRLRLQNHRKIFQNRIFPKLHCALGTEQH